MGRRLLLCFLVFGILSGFEVYQPKHGWEISREDPTLWVTFCDEDKEDLTAVIQFTIQAVLDQYNQIPTSYIELALLPTEAAIPFETVSTYSEELAAERTITICSGFSDPTASGQSLLDIDGTTWRGCEISLEQIQIGQVFQATLLHEMGHCLGLGHPQETEQAVMSYNASGFSELNLQIDDKMGVTYLYPASDDQGKEMFHLGFSSCSMD